LCNNSYIPNLLGINGTRKINKLTKHIKIDKCKTLNLDKATYKKIQELKKFVDLVVNLDVASKEHHSKAVEIKQLIHNIHNSDTHKNWNICLDIFDPEIKKGIVKEGFYWRKWSVYFETDCLVIEAETKHTTDPFGHYGNDFCYYGAIHFSKNYLGKPIYLDVDIGEFIKDAMNFKKYISQSLNELEININIDEK